MVDVSTSRRSRRRAKASEGGASVDVAADPPCMIRPCAACATLGGPPHKGGTTPARMDAERFGYPWGSVLCRACFGRLRDRAARAAFVQPCGRCGTPAGYVRPGTLSPLRYACDRFDGRFGGGVPGEQWCHDCVRAVPEASRAVFGGRKTRTEPCGPDAAEVRRRALAILTALAAPGDEAEARRLAAFDPDVTAEERDEWAREEVRLAARAAVADYRKTWPAARLGWPLRGKATATTATGATS